MERINFQDGQLVSQGYVEIDGTHHQIHEAEYTGTTPLSAYMLNKLQDNIETETDKIVDTVATTTKKGLMSSADKTKLNGIATGANNYSLPTASENTLGGVKVGNNLSILNGVLSATNTTYSNATTSSSGLMSSDDKAKLNGIATQANKTTVVDNLTSTSTTSALSAKQGKILKDSIGQFEQTQSRLSSGSNTYVEFDIDTNKTYLIILDKYDVTYNYGGAWLLVGRGTNLIPLGSTASYNPTTTKTNNTIKLNMINDTYFYVTVYAIA